MSKTTREKQEWIDQDHFVYYPQAMVVLKKLQRLYSRAEPSLTTLPVDQKGLGLVGHSGTGKTMILRECMLLNATRPHPDHERYLIAYCLLPDQMTGLTGLYSALLRALGHVYGDLAIVRKNHIRIAELESTLLYLLRKSEVRMFFIDEFQHVGITGKHQKSFLNQLKRTMLVAHIPFVPAGTPDAITVFASDESGQTQDRFPVTTTTTLDLWTFKRDFRMFLAGYEQFLPFPEPTGLSSKDLAEHVFNKVKYPDPAEMKRKEAEKGTNWRRYLLHSVERAGKTNLRNLVGFLQDAASAALLSKENRITEEIIVATPPKWD